METIPVRYEESFIRIIERIMRKHNYGTKAEFIREAVRDKVKDLEMQEALMRLERISGSSKRLTTKEQMGKAKKAAFEELANRYN